MALLLVGEDARPPWPGLCTALRRRGVVAKLMTLQPSKIGARELGRVRRFSEQLCEQQVARGIEPDVGHASTHAAHICYWLSAHVEKATAALKTAHEAPPTDGAAAGGERGADDIDVSEMEGEIHRR